MKWAKVFWTSTITAGLLLAPVYAQEAEDGTGLLGRAAKVDKPIADTYEPLSSTYVGDGDRLNETIEQSWQLKKQTREREPAAAQSVDNKKRTELEKRIQEPGGGAVTPADPVVESTDDSLSIRETP